MKKLLSSDFLPVPLNPTHPSDIAKFLKTTGFKPLKKLGQNFLIDFNILNTIIKAANLEKSDIILEIGTGLGALTIPLAERVAKVVTVEKDRRLTSVLQEQFVDFKNIVLIEQDAMRLDIKRLIMQYRINKIVANFPYSIASAFLMMLFKEGIKFNKIVVTLQREVALRILAHTGTSDYGLLSIWAQLNYQVERIKDISQNSFFPPPDVISSIVSFTPCDNEMLNDQNFRQLLFKITKAAFNSRRKQVKNTITFFPQDIIVKALNYAEIPLETRPECITIEQWLKFVKCISHKMSDT